MMLRSSRSKSLASTAGSVGRGKAVGGTMDR